MESWRIELYRDQFLAHHGIAGQKWGVRNGPPYPLDEVTNLRVRSHAKNPDNPDVKNRKVKDKKVSEKLADLSLKDREYSVEEDAKAVNDIFKNGYYGRVFNCRNCSIAYEMRRKGYDVEARIRPDGSNAEDPSEFFKDSTMVHAKAFPKDYDEIYRKSMREYVKENRSVFKNKQSLERDYRQRAINAASESYRNLCEELEKQPNGSRGILRVSWQKDHSDLTKRARYFHALNYEIIDNKVRFIDTEGKIIYNDFVYQYADPRDYSYVRTDNVEPNENVTLAVASRGKKNER